MMTLTWVIWEKFSENKKHLRLDWRGSTNRRHVCSVCTSSGHSLHPSLWAPGTLGTTWSGPTPPADPRLPPELSVGWRPHSPSPHATETKKNNYYIYGNHSFQLLTYILQPLSQHPASLSPFEDAVVCAIFTLTFSKQSIQP